MKQVRTVLVPGTGKRTVNVSTPLNSKRIWRVWADIARAAETRISKSTKLSLSVDNIEVFDNFPLRWLSSRYYAHLYSRHKLIEEDFAQPIGLPAQGSEMTITVDSIEPIVLTFEYDDLKPQSRPVFRYKVVNFVPGLRIVEKIDYDNPAHAHFKNTIMGYCDNLNAHVITLPDSIRGFFCENLIDYLGYSDFVKYENGVRKYRYQLNWLQKAYPAAGSKKTPSDNHLLRFTKTPEVPFTFPQSMLEELFSAIFGETTFEITDLANRSNKTGFLDAKLATMNAAIPIAHSYYPFEASKNLAITLRFPVFMNFPADPNALSGLPYQNQSIDFCFIY